MEKVNIKIDVGIITHPSVKEDPYVNISLNGYPQFGEILKNDTLVDIDVQIQDNAQNFLSVEYMNKDPYNDVYTGHDGEISQDKRVIINSISFDNIKLTFLNWTIPNIRTLIPEGKSATGFNASKLSWNGRTTLKFTTPIYIWLLENL